VIRRPAIYVFDDAFSALDVHTDALVRSRLAEIAADATVIVVAQRISTIIDADHVIVLDDGRVLDVGTHESLLAECPTYREFAESQSLDATVGGPR
jgi:ABC-type multidrug transport system fused ATPase/permease subunit